MILNSYADESWDAGNSKYLTVAGFLMTDAQFLDLDAKWEEALGGLPYFHMREGHHIKHPHVYKQLLSLLRTGMVSRGFAVFVDSAYYDTRASKRGTAEQALKYWRGGAYTYALQQYMELVGIWLDEREIKDASVAYIFESGHEKAGEANDFLGHVANDLFYYPKKQRIRYKRHKFIDGKSNIGRVLQAGDILAWQLNNMHPNDGVLSEDLNQIIDQVKIMYMYCRAEHIDSAFDDNADLASNYAAVRQASHAELKARKREGLPPVRY